MRAGNGDEEGQKGKWQGGREKTDDGMGVEEREKWNCIGTGEV
jgi:hypothetical protein